jgi:ABC-type polysaccharide/polyol phosphate transport system ATPase subunit
MDEDFAVVIDNVSKKYCKSLKRSMLYGMHDIGRNLMGMSSNPQVLRKDEFFAVKDVSFKLKRGETLGILGINGSGKSTLLKMINGIFWPDKGRIAISGKVGALIEVGAGFHTALTGRENVYINAAIYGMSREEIDEKFDDIVSFADIGDFIDVPVKHYSSGMFVRLGFSAAVHCNPDILVVDEVLAVGDLAFIEKCQEYIKRLLEKGVTLVLVSHNLRLMAAMCSRAIVLNQGRMVMDGDVNSAIRKYEDLLLEYEAGGVMATPYKKMNKCKIWNQQISDDNGIELEAYPIGGNIRYSFDYSLHPSVDLDKVRFSLGLMKEKEQFHVARYINTLNGFRLKHHEGRIEFLINTNVTSGNYMFDISFFDESILPLDIQFSSRFRVIHPCFPNVDKEYYGQFLLEPHIKTYPLNTQSDKQHGLVPQGTPR